MRAAAIILLVILPLGGRAATPAGHAASTSGAPVDNFE